METKPHKKSFTENFVRDIRNRTRRLFTSEQKILIVMEAIQGESPVSPPEKPVSAAEHSGFLLR